MSETRRPDDSWEWPSTDPTPAEMPAGAGATPPHPPTAVGVMIPPPPEPPRPKRKIMWGWWWLGFLMPFAVWGLEFVLITNSWFSDMSGGLASGISLVLAFGPFVVAVVALSMGAARHDEKLRSFGVGALWSYAVLTLIALLLFGTCLVSLSGWGK